MTKITQALWQSAIFKWSKEHFNGLQMVTLLQRNGLFREEISSVCIFTRTTRRVRAQLSIAIGRARGRARAPRDIMHFPHQLSTPDDPIEDIFQYIIIFSMNLIFEPV